MSNLNKTDVIFLTNKGFEQQKALLARKQEEYATVCEHRQIAFELSGDGWHDNPEFNRQQQLEANLNHTIKELTQRLTTAKKVEIVEGNRPTKTVEIGSFVNITRFNLDDDSSINENWEIVGYDETDIDNRQLAYNSPIAQAIMGLKLHDFSEELSIGSSIWEIEINNLFATRDDI